MKRNTRVRFLTEAAMIAAGYTVLTLLAMMLNLAYGPVQFRFSEALTVLPVLTPAAVPGLAVGCLLSNLWSSMGALDIIFGTAATLLAALTTYMVRNIRVKGIPILAPLPPVLFNALIVGVEITIVSPGGFLGERAQRGAGRAGCLLCTGPAAACSAGKGHGGR